MIEEVAVNIQAIKAEYENKIIDIYEQRPNDWKEIKLGAKNYRDRWLEKANSKVNEDGTAQEKDTKRTTLNELAVSQGMEYLLYIITLSNGRVAVYDPDNGYYHKDPSFAYKVIRLLEPTFNEQKAKNVLFMLSSNNRIHKYDGFSCNFSIGDFKNPKRFILVKNGIYDKKEQKLLGFTHQFVAFSTIATEYDAFAKSPVINGWDVDSWLLDLMDNDQELVDLLWQVISASLNGNYSYRKSIWFVGEGNDGKGTVQQLITNVIGLKNIATLKLNQFSERFALSMIEGKTVIIGDDVQAGIYVDESSNFNSVVTGEPVLVEEKNKQPYTTIFRKTVIQSTNELPRFKNKSNGTYRRFTIIPFRKTFSPKEDNWAIKDDYIYREDVREYVLKKALEINFNKFNEPSATKVQLEEFKESNDTVKAFVNEWFPKFESKRLPSKFLWWLYKAWCKDSGIVALNKFKFEKQLPTFLTGEWEKKVAKPIGFMPSVDTPTELGVFSWHDENDPKKATNCFIKL
nr:DNA primase family protein [Streptococcus iniae]